jgi:hypothetical protein
VLKAGDYDYIGAQGGREPSPKMARIVLVSRLAFSVSTPLSPLPLVVHGCFWALGLWALGLWGFWARVNLMNDGEMRVFEFWRVHS